MLNDCTHNAIGAHTHHTKCRHANTKRRLSRYNRNAQSTKSGRCRKLHDKIVVETFFNQFQMTAIE